MSLDSIFLKDFLKLFLNMPLEIRFAGVQIPKILDLQIKNYGETKQQKCGLASYHPPFFQNFFKNFNFIFFGIIFEDACSILGEWMYNSPIF